MNARAEHTKGATMDEQGPSILTFIDDLYDVAVKEIQMAIQSNLPGITETGVKNVKRAMCRQIHTLLREEREYCRSIFEVALKGDLLGWSSAMSGRWFFLESECKEKFGEWKLP